MKHVDMLITGDPEKGDCFRACVASILEMPIEQVPDFVNDDERNWWLNYKKWLAQFDLTDFYFYAPETYHASKMKFHYIASGQSPRNPRIQHAVIAFGSDLVHDPHPDRTFLVNNEIQSAHVFVMLKPDRNCFD